MNGQTDNKNRRRAKNYFIKKELQSRFILKFCLLVILACAIMGALVYALSEKTTTTGFEDLRLTVKSTADFILPTLLLSSLVAVILVSLATIIVFLFISHRFAGPIHRLETELVEIGKGDLTTDIRLRKKDELKPLAAIVNNMVHNIRNPLSAAQAKISELGEDLESIQKGLRAKGVSEEEIDRIIKPARKKVEQIKNGLSFFKVSSLALILGFIFCLSGADAYANVKDGVPPSELVSDEGWNITKSIFCTIYFRDDVNINNVNTLIDTYKVDYGLLEKPLRSAKNIEEEMGYKFDLIFYKVQELLDMRPKDLRVDVRIYRDQDNLDKIYMEIFDAQNKFIAFYVFKINTLFSCEEKISANVLAHEIAHCVVDHYFSVIPPTKVAEMIAQYADAHLRD